MADLTLKDVADELKVSTRTVRRLLSAGELAYYRVRRALRVEPAAVNDYKRRNWRSANSTADSLSSSSNPGPAYFDGFPLPQRKPRRSRLRLVSDNP